MSRDASISLTWAGDERLFRLGIDQCLALEERRKCSLYEIMERLGGRKWFIDDLREPLRLGLIGGGMDGAPARKLVEKHVTAGNLMPHALPAHAVVLAAIHGVPDEKVGKAGAGSTTRAKGSPPRKSSARAPRSGSRRKTSGK